MKQILLFTILIVVLISCNKSELSTPVVNDLREELTKPPGPIGGGGGTVQPVPTYLTPLGNSNYSCQYGGISVHVSGLSYSNSTISTDQFNYYGIYYTTDGYGNATTTSSNATGGGSGNVFTFTESYCVRRDTTTSICTQWGSRTITGRLVRVLNPQPGSPSFMALVPPNYFY